MLAELIQVLEQETLDNLEREERFITSEVNWQQYESLLLKLQDNSYYRVTYLDGVLEIVSPSRRHEGVKKRIGILLEVYLEETDTEYFPLGSTTLRRQERRGGTEPDESYCIGTEKEFPDLAVEVVFTKKGNSLTGNREWGMGNKKGRMPIPFDGDKEKKYIRLVAQPMPYGGLSFQSLPFQGHVMRVRKSPVPYSLFPVPL